MSPPASPISSWSRIAAVRTGIITIVVTADEGAARSEKKARRLRAFFNWNHLDR
jgi:hypothetical protein